MYRLLKEMEVGGIVSRPFVDDDGDENITPRYMFGIVDDIDRCCICLAAERTQNG